MSELERIIHDNSNGCLLYTSHTEESYNNPINQSATEKPQDDVIDSMDDAQACLLYTSRCV